MTKTSLLGFFAALFFGASVFGVYKAVEMKKKSDALNVAIADLRATLTVTRTDLENTREDLGQVQEANVRLEGDVNRLHSKLTQAQEKIAADEKSIVLLSKVAEQAKKINTFLLLRNDEMAKDRLRLEFENREMKKTLSSAPALKKVISELRRKPAPKQKKSSGSARVQKRVQKREEIKPKEIFRLPDDVTQKGNQGFVVKDGKSTFADSVDIKVVPAEAGIL